METQTICIKRCLQYTEDTPLFHLLNNNELIVLEEERHSVSEEQIFSICSMVYSARSRMEYLHIKENGVR